MPQVPYGAIGWVVGEQVSAASLFQHAQLLNYISSSRYRLRFAGPVVSLRPWWPLPDDLWHEVQRLSAHSRLPMLPLLACFGDCANTLSSALEDSTLRQQLIGKILSRLEQDAVDGIFIDFEGLQCSADLFARFIAELGRALHQRDLLLGVAVPMPKCAACPYPFDLGLLGGSADMLALMTYDHRVDGRGPIAPRLWLEQHFSWLRRQLGARWPKAYIGVPFYGRVAGFGEERSAVTWQGISSGTLMGCQLKLNAHIYDLQKLSRVAYGSCADGSRSLVLHYQDHVTLAQRLKLIKDQGFYRIAIWRLGGEDPRNWAVIRQWRGN